MTKEELIEEINNCTHWEDVRPIIEKLYEQNVVIPKGKNRHPHADVLHEWIEGRVEGVFKYPYGSHRGIAKHIFTEYSDFKIEEFKPLKPVYEWQWYYLNEQGYAVIDSGGHMTDDEVPPNPKRYKIEETKRERK